MIALITVALMVLRANAAITGDLSCASYNGSSFVYNANAVSCSNTYSDVACTALYPALDTTAGYPASGNDAGRPLHCYTLSSTASTSVNADLVQAAVQNCPKSCGYCCKTSSYTCSDKPYPRMDCKKMTKAMCQNPTWQKILAEDCPATCGLCNSGNCVDKAPDCAKYMCNRINLQDFVNQYCKRTCSRC